MKVLRKVRRGGKNPVAKPFNKHTGRNMYSISHIQQVLAGVPRGAFEAIVQRRGADRYSKGFGCWQQLLAMVYAQLAGVSSLRQLEAGLNSQRNQHYHLNTRGVRRSTLADANGKRDPAVFAELLEVLIAQAGRSVRGQREELLYLIDATKVDVPLARDQRRGIASAHDKCGMKLHVLLNASSAGVGAASITQANVNDLVEGRKLAIQAGATYVFDKGYCDYNWWARIDAAGARWVTRFKRDAALKVLEQRCVPRDAPQVLDDSVVAFARRTPRGGHRNPYSAPLRRIEIARPDAAPLVLATNDLDSDAAHIAQLYKERWQIELFFKWIKQHLQIRRFLGVSDNAIRIQLLTALIAYMLVVLLKHATGAKESLWMLLTRLRQTLFQRPRTEESWWRKRRRHMQFIASVQPSLL
jgi:IS4 transposase